MKRKISLGMLLILCVLATIYISRTAVNKGRDDGYYEMGQRYRQAMEAGAASPSDALAATYDGTPILMSTVAYHQAMSVYESGNDGTEPFSNREVIDRLALNLMLLDEAANRGLSATQTEIDEMVQNMRDAYATSSGKTMLDSYCEGAGISIEDYFDQIRDQAPTAIARQKLSEAVRREYCEANGLSFDKDGTSQAASDAERSFEDALFQQNQDKIVYLTGN